MRRQARKWIIFGSLIAIFVGVFIRGFLFETFRVATAEMEPNLLIGDLVVVSKFSYDFHLPDKAWSFLGLEAPQVGEVVLHGEGQNLSVGRIFATPGTQILHAQSKLYDLSFDELPLGIEGERLTVPAGYFLVVPDQHWMIENLEAYLIDQSEIIGNASRVWFSLDWGEDLKKPTVRWNRFFHEIDRNPD